MRENRRDDRLELQCGKETLEKYFFEVIKGKDSDINCEECMQHKYGEQ